MVDRRKLEELVNKLDQNWEFSHELRLLSPEKYSKQRHDLKAERKSLRTEIYSILKPAILKALAPTSNQDYKPDESLSKLSWPKSLFNEDDREQLYQEAKSKKVMPLEEFIETLEPLSNNIHRTEFQGAIRELEKEGKVEIILTSNYSITYPNFDIPCLGYKIK